MLRSKWLPLAAGLALVLCGCGDDGGGADSDGGNTDGDVTADGDTPADGDTTPPDGEVPPDAGDAGWRFGDGGCRQVRCQGHLYECANCMDDDGDGKIDAHDSDCLGPCDNNEEGFNLAIPGGDSAPCKLDCYYDQDEGSGNDKCKWDARCDPKEPDPDPLCTYDPDAPSADCPDPQADMCHDFCDPLTPNGCDCFGCCTFPEIADRSESEGGQFVFIGSVDGDGAPTCTLDNVTDTEKCHPCTPVEDCHNTCERCELCIGKTELPDDCFGPSPDGGVPDGGVPDSGVRCPGGEQPCGLEGDDPCPTGTYCITGCCQDGPE